MHVGEKIEYLRWRPPSCPTLSTSFQYSLILPSSKDQADNPTPLLYQRKTRHACVELHSEYSCLLASKERERRSWNVSLCNKNEQSANYDWILNFTDGWKSSSVFPSTGGRILYRSQSECTTRAVGGNRSLGILSQKICVACCIIIFNHCKLKKCRGKHYLWQHGYTPTKSFQEEGYTIPRSCSWPARWYPPYNTSERFGIAADSPLPSNVYEYKVLQLLLINLHVGVALVRTWDAADKTHCGAIFLVFIGFFLLLFFFLLLLCL